MPRLAGLAWPGQKAVESWGGRTGVSVVYSIKLWEGKRRLAIETSRKGNQPANQPVFQ